MELFQSKKNDELEMIHQPLEVVTPLGLIRLALDIGAGNLLDTSYICQQLQQGSYMYTWKSEQLVIEIMMAHPIIPLPLHMRVDGSCGLLIRVMNVSNDDVSLKCTAYWAEQQWITGGSSTGQYLEASTWESDTHYVSIGTEDAEALQDRSGTHNLMPIQIKDQNELTFSDINTIGMYLPSIASYKLCQFHFYIAWKKYTDDEDVDTWYAVDQQAQLILEHEECY
ncbi:hypothetical protein QCD85_06955 [Paenibacillus sp. PsM32]|uniref:hypothetical protein n=1 Tax=Paenibacillus sp. PsM32 TaxID=3030536 RepID=UPI00263B0941|nr:hypothetical protein [Paenibacillus sp. PsM32]MDN4617830.1 hypothetical protein [Paenibacillus sp. PsM32]